MRIARVVVGLSLRAALIASAWNTAAQADTVTHALVDGTIIHIGDFWQTIQVRGQSFGPGFCSVDISNSAASLNLAAPPLTWSNWADAGSYVGETDVHFDISNNCDTGTMLEVRYAK